VEGGTGHRQSRHIAVRRPRSLTAAWLCVLLGSSAASIEGQVVRGDVVDSMGSRPLSSVLVVLTDTTGRELARDLTDGMGRYLLRAGGPGTYRVRTLVVGYRRWESTAFTLNRGQSVERRIPLALVPIVLPSFTVEAERTCVLRPEEGAAAAALWEEVRKTLQVTQMTIDRRRYRFFTLETTREYDRLGALVDSSTQPQLGFTALGFGSASAEELARQGFVRAALGGPIYYAPDARVLVSDAFLDKHCFRVGRSSDGTRIGLRFEPVSRGDLPDVRGTLWLDSATVELRSLEWKYTELSRWAREADPGGTMEFARLPNGAWFIREWELTAPVARVIVGRNDTTLNSIKVRSGAVREVLSATGEVIVQFDSVRATPASIRR
jgi:hypothetical protein